jgi:hypothetical protein
MTQVTRNTIPRDKKQFINDCARNVSRSILRRLDLLCRLLVGEIMRTTDNIAQ